MTLDELKKDIDVGKLIDFYKREKEKALNIILNIDNIELLAKDHCAQELLNLANNFQRLVGVLLFVSSNVALINNDVNKKDILAVSEDLVKDMLSGEVRLV